MSLSELLLDHFDRHARDVPWRRTKDPYAILVSEVMLQQTRVDTVIPYYERWLTQFPTVSSLANAEEPDVLRAWEGLGYYSRARNLHAAARVVHEQHNGRVPDNAPSLRDLPGVGAYTAGAVSSIAYGRAEPAVDGNARRVFSRLLDLEQPSFASLQEIVKPYVPTDRPGDFNQAVMELGATICTPVNPRCSQCPVQKHCLAFRNGTVESRPGKPARKSVPHVDVATIVLLAADPESGALHTVVTQRPSGGMLAGFWEFPAIASAQSRLSRAARDVASRFTAHALPRAARPEPVRHAFSHRIETYHAFVFRLPEAAIDSRLEFIDGAPARWVDAGQLHALPLPVAQRRIARAAGLAPAAKSID